MNDNKILRQISSMFSIFMVIFYIGFGTFSIFFFDQSLIDRATRVIIGTAFIIYGVFRAFKTFFQVKELFFNTEIDDE